MFAFKDITNWTKGTEHINRLELFFKDRDHLIEKWETLAIAPEERWRLTLVQLQWTWVVGGGARPTKIMMPSPPGFPPMVSMSKSGFQLLMDQMLPA